MNLYTRTLKHIDMNRVKELHEEKIKQKEINEKIDEEVIAYDGPEFCNWREETDLKESEWTPSSGSGPTNSSSQQFTYAFPNFLTGQPNTVTVSGLGGIEGLPSSVTVNDGEVGPQDVPPPTYNQLAMQGYAPPLGKGVMKRNDDAEDLRKKQDKNLQKIKDTLKNLGTSWEKMRANNWALLKDDGTSIILEPITPGNKQLNWIDNSKITVGKKHRDAGPGQNPYKVTNPDGSITMEFSEIVSVETFQVNDNPINKQLDASQEFTQNVGADYMMDARVQDTPEQPSFLTKKNTPKQPSKRGRVQVTNNTSMLPIFPGVPRHNPLANLTQIPGGLPYSDAIAATIRYATGNYDPNVPIKGGQSAALELSVLNSIENEIRNGRIKKDSSRPGYFTVAGGQQSYEGPGGSLTNNYLTNASAQALLQAYSFKPGKKGISVSDRFNLTGSRNIGGAALISNALNYYFGTNFSFEQDFVNALIDRGDDIIRTRGGDPKDDATAGFDVEFTIPWERVPNNHPLRGNIKESTWNKLKKYRITN